MNIDFLIQLLENRYKGLILAKDHAFQSGDLERINVVDAEMLDVQNTLGKLKLVSSIEQTAIATSMSEAAVVKAGIESVFNPTVINDATRTLLNYDITPYATDPNHEMRIQSILEKMGFMDSVDQIDAYLKSKAPTTPVTGLMVLSSSVKYSVDTRLVLAIMEQDSAFGTLGVGARTFNPGNVGNTGSAERTYPSWEAGVDAVALWLSNHRRTVTVEDIVSQTPAATTSTETETVSEKNYTEEKVGNDEESSSDSDSSEDTSESNSSSDTNASSTASSTPSASSTEQVVIDPVTPVVEPEASSTPPVETPIETPAEVPVEVPTEAPVDTGSSTTATQ